MERMWRKVNQGLTNFSKTTTTTTNHSNDGNTVVVVGGGGVVGFSDTPPIVVSSSTRRSQQQTIGNTASSERRRRRRRKNIKQSGGGSNSGNCTTTSNHTLKSNTNNDTLNLSTKNIIVAPTTTATTATATTTNDTTLKQRAVAKFKMFNFHLNWDLQCKPSCGPSSSSGNILTRRLCRNRRGEDNELYRSNSFKFERFERKEVLNNDTGLGTLTKQISVCDDYSLPVDFVKKRPSSFDPCLAERILDNWASPSPLSEHVTFLETVITEATPVKIVEGYSYPKDTKKNRRKRDNSIKKPTPKKEYLQLYSSDSSAPKSSEDEEQLTQVPELNSPDSISEDLVRPLQSQKSPKRLTGPESSKRNPSPYYYSDLLKNKETTQNKSSKTIDIKNIQEHNIGKYRKSNSLDNPVPEKEDISIPKRYSITEGGVRIIRCDSPSTTTSDDSDCTECQKRRDWHSQALALVRDSCNVVPSMPPHRLLGPAICACAVPNFSDDRDELFRPRSIFYVHQQGTDECADCTLKTNNTNNLLIDNDEMSGNHHRTHQFYETAFDCKISRSDDDLDEVERITNHSLLLQLNNKLVINNQVTSKEIKNKQNNKSTRLESKRTKNNKNHVQTKSDTGDSGSTISQEMENMHITNSNLENLNNANTVSSSQLPLRGYTPSPPSTAPLPIKFPGKHNETKYFMNSIKSAPNLPSTNPSAQHPRLRELRLPVDNSQHRNNTHDTLPICNDDIIVDNFQRNSDNRPRSVVLESSRVLELKRKHHGKSHHHHHQRGGGGGVRNFSSTESMATSSSGGSMESIRSSTSEGNRSTSSSDSRHSTSLSSHSSDSGPSISYPLRAPIVLHTKLHILSPISDKSLEPGSETSDILNRNNNSQKVSPDENTNKIMTDEIDNANKIIIRKRNIPQNKTLLTIKGKMDTHLLKTGRKLHVPLFAGDEIQGSDSGISLHSRDESKSRSAFQPFVGQKIELTTTDKLDNNTTTTTTTGLPLELNDLPFDMPKLRRRKILPQQNACTSGSATSVDLGELPFDMPKLRRRLRLSQPQTTTIAHTSTESSGISQASSSQSVRDDKSMIGATMFRQNLTLNLGETKTPRKFNTLEFGTTRGLNFNIGGNTTGVDLIDATLPLDRQGWYHGAISRVEAENTLRSLTEGSFLVRNSESTRQDYSLTLKSAKGFMHMRIQRSVETGQYILGQFSRPFESIPEMIRHFCLNRLPVRGAEHMCLLEPVIAQLL